MTNTASFLIQQLPYLAPHAVVFLVGLVISLVHLSRYKKPAVLASIGFAILLCSTLLPPVLYVIAHSLVGQGGWARVGQLNLLVGIGNSLIHVVGYSLLIVAIFIDRRLPSKHDVRRHDPVADFHSRLPVRDATRRWRHEQAAQESTMPHSVESRRHKDSFHPGISQLLGLALLAIPVPIWGEDVPADNGAKPAFMEAVYCAVCHANARHATAMRDAQNRGISPYDLWATSSMAHSARDPYWRAALSAEVAAVPSARVAIETKCTRCHAPMADAQQIQPNGPLLAHLQTATGEPTSALDGVSCTVCHQILPVAPGDESHYSGGFTIGPKGPIFGPHQDPFPMPMRRHTGYTPTFSAHLRAPEFCAPCHTLDTAALTADGQPTGHTLHEQNPFREWRNSLFAQPENAAGPPRATCQDCHIPTQDDAGKAIETRIAHNPGGRDFPFLSPRSPFGQHRFLGANTVLARLMSSHFADASPESGPSPAALRERVVETQRHLQQAARVTIETPVGTAEQIAVPVAVENLTGHKFPTGYPSRRAWLQMLVKDAKGTIVFASGTANSAGVLVDERGNILPCELKDGPVEPHRPQIKASQEVQIYESVMLDSDGNPTFRLLRGTTYGKDSRLLPQGWSAEHPDAETTASVGTSGDPDFHAGSDRVIYLVRLTGTGPWTMEATLYYQTISARHLAELESYDTPEVRVFAQALTAERRRPEMVTQASLAWPPQTTTAGKP